MSISARALRVAPAIVALGLLLFGSGPALAAVRTVAIDGTKFDPETVTVKAGDTVVWINKDPFPHTVTSQAGGFDSQGNRRGQVVAIQDEQARRVSLRLHFSSDHEGDAEGGMTVP